MLTPPGHCQENGAAPARNLFVPLAIFNSRQASRGSTAYPDRRTCGGQVSLPGRICCLTSDWKAQQGEVRCGASCRGGQIGAPSAPTTPDAFALAVIALRT